MNIIRIIEWFVAIPDDSKGCRDIGLVGDVVEEQVLTVNSVREQLCVHLLHATFNIELTDETNGDARLRNVHYAHGDSLGAARWHEN